MTHVNFGDRPFVYEGLDEQNRLLVVGEYPGVGRVKVLVEDAHWEGDFDKARELAGDDRALQQLVETTYQKGIK